MSRQPTWDLACALQGEMFDAVAKAGSLSVQLVYYRGLSECRASRFVSDTEALKGLMERIDCRGGHTQIGKVLSHALKEHARGKVNALVFIGDAMEESVDDLADQAGRLGLRRTARVPVPGGQRQRRRADLQGAGAAVARRLVPLRPRRGGSARPAAVGRGGVRQRRPAALEARGRPEDRLLISHLTGGGGR